MNYFGLRRNPIVIAVAGLVVLVLGAIKGLLLVIGLGVVIIGVAAVRFLTGFR
jgi:hypothetical protein